MYGNVGLSTPRGSGTNGYVVRNLSFIRPRKDIQIESLDEAKANPSALSNRKPNQEILDHEKKRQVELKCVAFQQKLEEAGRSEEEIEEEVNAFRQSMLKSIDVVRDNKNIQEYQTHHLSQAKITENEKMMRALGINSQDYVEGAAFDRDLQEQKKRERIVQREKKESEERQKRLEERERDLREREKINRNKNEKQHSIHRERDRRLVEKDADKKYLRRGEKNSSDSASDNESGNTESDSSRDNRNKRYHTSHPVSKQEDSDTNENISRRKKDDYSDRDIERYYDQKDHRMPRSPRRRQRSLTRRRNRDSSIPSSRRHRDGSLSPVPRRNQDIASIRRYRDDSLSPPRRRQRSPKEVSKYSERKPSLRSVSPPSHTYYKEENVRSRYRNEFETRRDISSSDKRNDFLDYSPRSNYNEDIGLSSRHYRYNKEDRSPSHDRLSHRRIEKRNNSRFDADRVRKIRSSSEESDYNKNRRRRRRRDDTSDSELEEDRGRKVPRKIIDYDSSSNSDTEGERHYSKD